MVSPIVCGFQNSSTCPPLTSLYVLFCVVGCVVFCCAVSIVGVPLFLPYRSIYINVMCVCPVSPVASKTSLSNGQLLFALFVNFFAFAAVQMPYPVVVLCGYGAYAISFGIIAAELIGGGSSEKEASS